MPSHRRRPAATSTWGAAHWAGRRRLAAKLFEFDRRDGVAWDALRDPLRAIHARAVANEARDEDELAFRFIARFWFARADMRRWPCRDDELFMADDAATATNLAWMGKGYDVANVHAALGDGPAAVRRALRSCGHDTASPWAPAANVDFTDVMVRVLETRRMCVSPSTAGAAGAPPRRRRPRVADDVDPARELAQWFDVWARLGGGDVPAATAPDADVAALEEKRVALLGLCGGVAGEAAPSAAAPATTNWRRHAYALGGRSEGSVADYVDLCASRGVRPVAVDAKQVLAQRYKTVDGIARQLARRCLSAACRTAADVDVLEAWVGDDDPDEFWKLKVCVAHALLVSQKSALAPEAAAPEAVAPEAAAPAATTLAELGSAPLGFFLFVVAAPSPPPPVPEGDDDGEG